MMCKNLYRSKIQELNTKRKRHQRIKNQTQKTVLSTKSRNKKLQQKDYKELITFLEKHDYHKTYKDSKIKMTQTHDIKIKKTTRNTQKLNLKQKDKNKNVKFLN